MSVESAAVTMFGREFQLLAAVQQIPVPSNSLSICISEHSITGSGYRVKDRVGSKL